jgi:hypothetical protein
MAYAAIVRARHDKEDECIRKLKEARAESEEMYAKLHEIRTGKKPAQDEHLTPPNPTKALTVLEQALRSARQEKAT